MGKIQFQNVNKVYPNGFHAIHDFNLDVDDGEFIVFVGPSGCGKSTVLRMLAGLEEITSGKLLLDGKVINNRPPVERDIAIVFQDYALYGNLSVYDNVGISMKVQHQKDTAIYDKVQQRRQRWISSNISTGCGAAFWWTETAGGSGTFHHSSSQGIPDG